MKKTDKKSRGRQRFIEKNSGCRAKGDAEGAEWCKLTRSTKFARIAQLVEHLICNQAVVGSNPTSGSIFITRLKQAYYGFRNPRRPFFLHRKGNFRAGVFRVGGIGLQNPLSFDGSESIRESIFRENLPGILMQKSFAPLLAYDLLSVG